MTRTLAIGLTMVTAAGIAVYVTFLGWLAGKLRDWWHVDDSLAFVGLLATSLCITGLIFIISSV